METVMEVAMPGSGEAILALLALSVILVWLLFFGPTPIPIVMPSPSRGQIVQEALDAGTLHLLIEDEVAGPILRPEVLSRPDVVMCPWCSTPLIGNKKWGTGERDECLVAYVARAPLVMSVPAHAPPASPHLAAKAKREGARYYQAIDPADGSLKWFYSSR